MRYPTDECDHESEACVKRLSTTSPVSRPKSVNETLDLVRPARSHAERSEDEALAIAAYEMRAVRTARRKP